MSHLLVLLAILPAIRVVAPEDGCPARAAVEAALLPVLRGQQQAGPAGLPGQIEIVDQGPGYRVAVAGAMRRFEDARRDCAERARAAAVFVALVLDPPAIDLVFAPGPAAPRDLPRPLPRVDVELAAVVDGAPGAAGGTLVAGGGEIFLAVGGRHVGGVAGVGALSPVIMDLPGARARLWRAPLDLGLRLGLERGRVELGLDLGLRAGVLVVEGVDVPDPQDEVRLELGLRLAGLVRLRVSPRLAPFVALQAVIVPRPYDLVVDPAGPVGSTPIVWLGAAAGLSIRAR